MADLAPAQRLTSCLAVVGLACRFPDADDAPALLDIVLTGRRAFRRIPPVRLDLAEYFQPDPATSDATYSTRAALIEGWRFDCAAFGIEPAAYAAADPALWLALETTARALAGAGLTGGTGLDRDRTGVIIGNTLGGDTSRANALRVRWPYVRRVLSDALASQELPARLTAAVLRRAERQYLAPFPAIGPETLAGGTGGTIAAAICSYFGFRGGSHAIDSACSSSTQAVASACTALATGEIDAAIAGGVDVSVDPLELIGLAKAGVLACDDVRIYDEQPTGFLPAEGCGVVVLMRTADARAAGLPVYAEIAGWGTSASSHAEQDERRVSAQLLAMQRAYERAGVDPAEIQLLEGNGAGTSEDDDAELAALGILRKGAHQAAVLGSVKANIGHAGAAAGVAGLIKTVLSVSNGVLPPASGVRRPHPMITDGDAQLTLPQIAREWPEGVRFAGVSTLSSAGPNVHLVLRGDAAARPRHDRPWRSRLMPARSLDARDPVMPRLMADVSEPVPFLLHAPDMFALVAVLNRLAAIARWLSDAELQDLACSLGRDLGPQGRARVALVAAGQEQLGALAAKAAELLPALADGLLTMRPGIFAGQDADGRVTLLLSDADGVPADGGPLTGTVSGCLETLRWLEALDAQAACAVGHGMGALAGLAWAGVLGQDEVIEIAGLRAKFLRRAAAADGHAGPARPARRVDAIALRAAIGQKYRFGPPRRRLISTFTGTEIVSVDDAIDLICSGFAGADHVADAITAGAVGATLLLETGPRDALTEVATATAAVPAVSLTSGFSDPADSARVAGALFAAGALGQPQALFAGRPSRPVDIWRERTFIGSPCETRPQFRAPAARQARPADIAEGTGGADITATATATAAAEPATAEAAEPVKANHDPEPAGQPGATQAAEPAAAQPATAEAADAAKPNRVPEPAGQPGATQATGATQVAEPAGQPGATQATEATRVAEPAAAQPATAEAAGAIQVPEPADAPAPTGAADPAAERAAMASAEVPSGHPASPAPSGDDDGAAEKAAALTESRRPASLSDLRADFERQPPARHADQLAGAGPWARCYAEVVRPAEHPAGAGASLTWRLHVSGTSARLAAARGVFAADAAAPRTIAIIGDPSDDDARAVAIQAAREAIQTGQLVVVTTSPDFTGFFAGLHAEHPAIGVTLLRVPSEESLQLAPKYASAEPGRFRELILAPDGSAGEPAMSELPLTGGAPCPLGPQDVVLVSRGARGAGLALAQVLACCGTAVAVIGRPDGDDSELVAGLELLRSAGARVGYEVIDLANPTSLAAAVHRIEERLGPVTAIGHAVSPSDPVLLPDLTDIEIADHAASEAAALDRLVGSVRAGQLRMIITFGSVAGRYGLAGGAVTALSSGALAARTAQLAGTGTCQSLHIDIPAWSTAGLGDHRALADYLAAAGMPPIDVSAASRLLLKIMTTPELPERVALHGRVCGPAARIASVPDPAGITPADLAAAGLGGGGRFLQDTLVHYPGIELVCAARLSIETDPYLADYQVDGLPMLPPALALEALAQAASVLAGRPVRSASRVRLESPVVIPAGGHAELRICALRDGRTVTAVLRCADSSFAVDHARAEFSFAETSDLSPAVAAHTVFSQLSDGMSGLVDGSELYGPIAFQDGRFRRIALLPEVTTRSCRALARGADDQPWFEPGSTLADSQFLLGSPGLADATLQVLQACMPHRRLRVAGCSAARFSGRTAEGAVEILASAVPAAGVIPAQAPAPSAESGAGHPPGSPAEMTAEELADQQAADGRPLSRKARRAERQRARQQSLSRPARVAGPAGPAGAVTPAGLGGPGGTGVPGQAAAPPQEHVGRHQPVLSTPAQLIADQRWDIEAVDSAGHVLLAWRGVELRDAGPLPRHTAWPPSLLAVYLERAGREAGLNDSLRVSVSCGEPAMAGSQLLAATPARGSGRQSGLPGGPGRAAARPRPDGSRAGSARAAAAPGSGPLAGFSLAVTASVPVACAWSVIEPGQRLDQPPAAIATVYSQLRAQLPDPPVTLATRLRVIGACLAVAGLPAPRASEWAATTTFDGWVIVRTPAARVACAVIGLSGVPGPVAVAILTGHSAAAGSSPARARPGAEAEEEEEDATTSSVPG